MNDKIKVGIVGSKFAADFHAFSYHRNPAVEIIAVAAIDNLEPFSKKWNIPKTYADYHQMLAKEDLDLVYGSAGNIKADLTFGSCLNVYSHPGYTYAIEKADNTLGWTKPAVDEFLNLGYVDELAYAVNCVRQNREPIYGCSGELGLACVEIITALYQSNQTGALVRGKWG